MVNHGRLWGELEDITTITCSTSREAYMWLLCRLRVRDKLHHFISYLLRTNMLPLTSIRTSNGKLEIVNQLLLPHTVQFLEINTIAAAHDAIKTMKVQFPLPLQCHFCSLTKTVDSGSTSYSLPGISLRCFSSFRGIGCFPSTRLFGIFGHSEAPCRRDTIISCDCPSYSCEPQCSYNPS